MPKKNMTIDDLAVQMQKGFVNAEKKTDDKIDDLAVQMQKGFVNAEKKTDDKIDDLARMVQGGFAEQDRKFDVRISGVEKQVATLRTEMHDEFRRVHEEIDEVKTQITQLEQRTKEDDDLFISQLFALKKKVAFLEKKVNALETAR